MSRPDDITVQTFRSPEGVRGRLGRLQRSGGKHCYEDALVYCRARGCGAWQGRTACAAPATWVVLGGPALPFLLYRAVFPDGGPALAVLCDDHAEDMTGTMPPELLRSQEYEFRSHLRLRGIIGQENSARVAVVLPLDDDVLGRIEHGLVEGWGL